MSRWLSVITMVLIGIGATAPSYAADPPEPDPWTIKADDDLRSALDDYIKSSMAIEDMRIYQVGNWMSYGGTKEARIPMLPIDDLLACFHQTSPESRMVVDTGGGVHIEVDDVQFSKGKWDAIFRLTEETKIDLLDKEDYFLADQLRVGTLKFDDPAEMIKVVRIMSAACFPDEAEN